MIKIAIENFKNGYSCSESIVKAANDIGLVEDNLINVATSFSGGLGNGCLCGAVSGSLIVIGAIHGRNKDNKARDLTKKFVEEFKKVKKVTCCKALTKNIEFNTLERKQHCVDIVATSCQILIKVLEEINIKVR